MKRSTTAKTPAPDVSAATDQAVASADVTAPTTGSPLIASVESIILPKGLYLISVRGTSAPMQVGGMILPAMLVGPGPGVSPDAIDFMLGADMAASWLCKPGDRLVAKVKGAAVPLLLTSIRTAALTPLLVEVENLEKRRDETSAPTPEQPPENETGEIPLRIVAHIQNRGDVPFINAPWAGLAGERLAVEGFSVAPLRKIAAADIEYKALSAKRSETPWVTGEALCGTRGQNLPLVGFCIRVKPRADGKRFDCEYSGTFASGKVVGPVRNGAPCWSTAPGDFLEALQVKIVERPAS